MSARRRSDPPRELLDDRGRPIHERIRQLRTEMGLTASELARRADISPAYVTRIEKGEKIPGEEVAVKIAKILGDDPELYLWWVHGRFISDPRSTLEGFRKSTASDLPASAPHSVDPREREDAERNREHLRREIETQEQLLRSLSDQRKRLEHEVARQDETLERMSLPLESRPRMDRVSMMRPSRRFMWRKKKQEPRERPLTELNAQETLPIVAEESGVAHDYRADPLYDGARTEEGPAFSLEADSVPIRVRLYDNADPGRGTPEWLWLDPKLLPEGVEGSKIVAHRLSEDDAAHLGGLDSGDVVVVSRGFDDPPDPDRIYLLAAQEASRSPTRLSRVRVKENQLILILEGERNDVEIVELSRERTLSHWLIGTVVVVIRGGGQPPARTA